MIPHLTPADLEPLRRHQEDIVHSHLSGWLRWMLFRNGLYLGSVRYRVRTRAWEYRFPKQPWRGTTNAITGVRRLIGVDA